ncbi:MAG TPA: hypothetical protein VEA63_07905, partial [Opitutus sp.]|nr:hypothetical protein [Opitutus sp.]
RSAHACTVQARDQTRDERGSRRVDGSEFHSEISKKCLRTRKNRRASLALLLRLLRLFAANHLPAPPVASGTSCTLCCDAIVNHAVHAPICIRKAATNHSHSRDFPVAAGVPACLPV